MPARRPPVFRHCRRQFLAASAAVLATIPAARAEANDRFGFDIPGLVIVWSATESGDAPVVSDFVIDSGDGANDIDLIAQDALTVVTGTLLPARTNEGSIFDIDGPGGSFDVDSNDNDVTDGDDSFSAFALDGGTELGVGGPETRTSFYVASNVPFNLDAQATQAGGAFAAILLDRISIRMSVTQSGDDGLRFGDRAQLPHSDGPTGGMTNINTLFQIFNRQTIFQGNQATAAGRGSIADQSVRFDIDYGLGGFGQFFNTRPTDLSDGVFEIEAEVVYTVWVP